VIHSLRKYDSGDDDSDGSVTRNGNEDGVEDGISLVRE
jgi:hypothetical protein